MTGHLGDETVTTQNLDVVRIDEARQLLLVAARSRARRTATWSCARPSRRVPRPAEKGAK